MYYILYIYSSCVCVSQSSCRRSQVFTPRVNNENEGYGLEKGPIVIEVKRIYWVERR